MGVILEPFRQLLERGGPVLPVIFLVSTLMWLWILDRYRHYRSTWPRLLHRAVRDNAHAGNEQARELYRHGLLLELGAALEERLATILICARLLPLLGLLGTVTGMIAIFEVINVFGTGNLRGMAQGISRALLPTTAGLVTALPGLLCHTDLCRRAEAHKRRARELLV